METLLPSYDQSPRMNRSCSKPAVDAHLGNLAQPVNAQRLLITFTSAPCAAHTAPVERSKAKRKHEERSMTRLLPDAFIAVLIVAVSMNAVVTVPPVQMTAMTEFGGIAPHLLTHRRNTLLARSDRRAERLEGHPSKTVGGGNWVSLISSLGGE